MYRAALLCLDKLFFLCNNRLMPGEDLHALGMAQAASVKTEVKKQNFTPIERRCKGNWLILVKLGAV
ncbi:hypothetical protein VU01_11542 [Candidatus Electrothrix marina]|uniref:Uncharacterized protein n=2 Tax=Candidatus Electrothrix TaxID=1859128 RepID=A0A3S4THA2_9BACT|nr:hypothetical protein [Desulfobulbus sp. N3]RWX44779.1 hypothetical protein VT98_13602 [Candidatus Electrothrix communis]RWX50937.1 hypothetical protein VU00_10032 [Candidatus Electrothrix marina]RWX51345.1 hypothetical protein VU01_11542 [Candidatus Electrothrix marina]